MCFGDTTKQTHQFDALAEAFGLDKQLLDSYFVQHLSATPESASTTPVSHANSDSYLSHSNSNSHSNSHSHGLGLDDGSFAPFEQQATAADAFGFGFGTGFGFGMGVNDAPLFPHDPFSGLDLSGIPLMDPDAFFESSPATGFFLPPSAFTLPATATATATATTTATETETAATTTSDRRAHHAHSGTVAKKTSGTRHGMKREVAEWLEQHPEPLGVAKGEDDETATMTATATATATATETNDALRLRRRLRNRTSAQQSRARRRAHTQQLEHEAARLLDLGGTLRSQLVVLETENKLLMAQLAELHSVVAMAARIGHAQPHLQFAIPATATATATTCFPHQQPQPQAQHTPAASFDWLLQHASY